MPVYFHNRALRLTLVLLTESSPNPQTLHGGGRTSLATLAGRWAAQPGLVSPRAWEVIHRQICPTSPRPPTSRTHPARSALAPLCCHLPPIMAGAMAFLPAAPSVGSLKASSWTAATVSARPRHAAAAATRPAARRAAPSPAAPSMSILPLLAFAGWAYAAVRFASGFQETTYDDKMKVPLAAAWPVLLILNAKYRKNFSKAIKGRD